MAACGCPEYGSERSVRELGEARSALQRPKRPRGNTSGSGREAPAKEHQPAGRRSPIGMVRVLAGTNDPELTGQLTGTTFTKAGGIHSITSGRQKLRRNTDRLLGVEFRHQFQRRRAGAVGSHLLHPSEQERTRQDETVKKMEQGALHGLAGGKRRPSTQRSGKVNTFFDRTSLPDQSWSKVRASPIQLNAQDHSRSRQGPVAPRSQRLPWNESPDLPGGVARP